MVNLRNLEKALQTLDQVKYEENDDEKVLATHPLIKDIVGFGRDRSEALFDLRFELGELRLEILLQSV